MDAAPSSPPPGWRLDENGAWRRETVHRMTRRCLGWDYGQRAIYEITVELTALGKAVADCWESIPKFYPKETIAKPLRPGAGETPPPQKTPLHGAGPSRPRRMKRVLQLPPKVKIIGKRVMPDSRGLITC